MSDNNPQLSRAFDNWYADGNAYAAEVLHMAEFEQAIHDSDMISRISLEARKAIVSDDVVDGELWLSLRGMNEKDIDWGMSR
jgi:hypothetical protein